MELKITWRPLRFECQQLRGVGHLIQASQDKRNGVRLATIVDFADLSCYREDHVSFDPNHSHRRRNRTPIAVCHYQEIWIVLNKGNVSMHSLAHREKSLNFSFWRKAGFTHCLVADITHYYGRNALI